jgi:hypothetical protein
MERHNKFFFTCSKLYLETWKVDMSEENIRRKRREKINIENATLMLEILISVGSGV